MQPPDISISIVSYNACDELRVCLASLRQRRAEGEVSFEVIVTDNLSSDASMEMVRDEFPEVALIDATENLGYGRANNLAFEKANGRYFLILNSDTEVVPGVLRELRDFLDSHPEAIAAGAQLISHSGELQPSCGRDPNLRDLFLQQISPGRATTEGIVPAGEEPLKVDWLCGACLCVRREAFAEINGFDPAFFMYLEDCDLCLRLRNGSGGLFLLPGVKVPHHLGASSRPWRIRARIIAAHNWSCWYFFRKHKSAFHARLAKAFCIMGALLRLGLWTVLAPLKSGGMDKVRLFREVLRETIRIGE